MAHAPSKRKRKKVVVYKAKVKVLDNLALQGVCSCGWEGNAIAQSSGANAAYLAAAKEIDDHQHVV